MAKNQYWEFDLRNNYFGNGLFAVVTFYFHQGSYSSRMTFNEDVITEKEIFEGLLD